MNWINKGHGQGVGENYQPFFKVRDVPSTGRSHRVWGLKNGRIQEYLSDTEYAPNVLAEYSPHVSDIREQFALLPWEETQEIAKELGVKHPVYPGTTTPIVMTTDLVVTLTSPVHPFDVSGQTKLPISSSLLNGCYLPICVKPEKYLEFDETLPLKEAKTVRRVKEKIWIEKVYWERRGLPLLITSPKRMPWNRATNLDNYRISILARELDWLTKYLPDFCELFLMKWRQDRPLKELIEIVGKRINLDINHSTNLLGRALWLKLLPINLDHEIILFNFPVQLIDNGPQRLELLRDEQNFVNRYGRQECSSTGLQ